MALIVRKIRILIETSMLSKGTASVYLSKTVDRGIWTCKACTETQRHLYAAQSSHRRDFSSSPTDRPLSPIDTFRQKCAAREPSVQSEKQTQSPADVFRRSWKDISPPEPPAQSIPQKFALHELADAYRKSGVPRTYVKSDVSVRKQKQEIREIVLEDVEMDNEMSELSQLDDIDTVERFDIFAGENMRDFQGVIALHGQNNVECKSLIKQGCLVEVRGTNTYILSPFWLSAGNSCMLG